jgi:hypothetical protein
MKAANCMDSLSCFFHIVRLRDPGANALLQRISAEIQENSLESMSGCIAVLTDHKLRIRKPEDRLQGVEKEDGQERCN